MNTRRIFLSCLMLFVLLCLAGCGKSVKLPIGDAVSDASCLSEGRFHETLIDTSQIPGDFFESASYITDSGYSYILTYYNFSSSINEDYLVSFDKSGNIIINSIVDKPVRSDNGVLTISSICGDVDLLDHISGDYDCYVNYSEYEFDNSGAFSSVCNVYISYALENGIGDAISEYYRVNWDSTGKCTSVSPVEDDYSASHGQYDPVIKGLDNNRYDQTVSGIILTDEYGKYVDIYFNFINSGIFSYGFDDVHIIDSDSFSGIYRNEDNKPVLSCFIRDNSNTDQKPLVIASSDLDFELMKEVLAFNSENGDFDIALIDYSDRSIEKDPLEGWSLLKEDVESSFRPDIILNTTGNDTYFTSGLSSQSLVLDLKKVISSDPDLKDVSFTDKAKSLFYSGEQIYSVIPSYSYRTVAGNAEKLCSVNWDINTFMDYANATDDSAMFFFMDHKDAFLKRLIEFNGSSYVDMNTGTASFDSDEFLKFLEYASKLPDTYSEASALYYFGLEPCDVLLNDQLCNGLGNMYFEAVVKLRGGFVDLGFPVSTEPGSGVISADNSFLILADRKYTNECWSFVKNYLTPDYQNQINLGIPVTESGFQAWTGIRSNDFDYFSSNTYYKDGVEYIVELPSDEEVETMLKNINDCRRIEFSDYRVEEIVLNYAHQYFDGKITAQEAASAIDKDVEAYLAS